MYYVGVSPIFIQIMSPALLALVDQWRPETHIFHLSCGEATMTLQDITMLLGLPIDGHLMCGLVDPAGWKDKVGELIDIRPPNFGPNDKDKKSSGVHSSWLIVNLHMCPNGANNGVVQRYAHTWFWHMVVDFSIL
jgi:hypothetical protein